MEACIEFTVDVNGFRIITIPADQKEIWHTRGLTPMKLMKVFDIKK